MKQTLKLFVFFFFILATLISCSKGGSDKPEVQEAALAVKLDPEPTGGLNQSMGTEYKFNVVIQSEMPAQGVAIKVDYVKDSGGSVFSQILTTSNATSPITITQIPFNEVGTVTVSVASVSKPTNNVVKTFKLVRK